MNDQLPDDYAYFKTCVSNNPDIFLSEKSFKYELSCYRNAWREAGVIIETGTGELRRRVLLSRSRYINFWRQRTRANVA